MKLEFSKKTIPEILAEYDDKKTFDWQNDIFDFLKNYKDDDTIKFLYQQKDNLYQSVFKRDFVCATFKSMNDFLGLQKGDTALLTSSVLQNEGKIMMVQAIEGGLDLYCSDNFEEIKIPFTGENQDEIGFAIDYCFISQKQAENSGAELVRIKKISVGAESLPENLNQNQKTSFYNTFIAHGYPIGIKKYGDTNFTVLDGVDLSEDEDDNLILDSTYEDESLNIRRQAYISEDKKEFRFLSNSEYRMGNDRKLVNFDSIEKKLENYIDLNFAVLGFPDKETGEEVVTLVIGSRFVQEIDIPNDELEEHESPKQTFYIGEFPENSEKSAIRAELKKLLQTQND